MNQKFIQVTKQIGVLAQLNSYWLLFSLPIVTMIPATYSLITCLAHKNRESHHLFHLFNTTFKSQLSWQKLGKSVGIFLIGISGGKLIFVSLTDKRWLLLYLVIGGMIQVFILVIIQTYLKTLNHKDTIGSQFLQLCHKFPLILVKLMIKLILLLLCMSVYPKISFFFFISGPAYVITQHLVKLHQYSY